MKIRNYIQAFLTAFTLASCSTPSAVLKVVPAASSPVALDFRMKGCWGFGTACYGVGRIRFYEVRNKRLLWELQLPGAQAGRILYGRIPDLSQLEPSEQHNKGPWPKPDNPGYQKAKALPIATDLVASVQYYYDGPWPSTSQSSCYFKINGDGSITHLDPNSVRGKKTQKTQKTTSCTP